MARSYKELVVWQKSIDLAVLLYRQGEAFPKSELYGLTSQIRRSVVSIASNIAEGSERRSDKAFVRFLNIAKGSLAECETQMIIAHTLGYLNDAYENISKYAAEIGKMINGLCAKLDKPNLATEAWRLETEHA
jgi:four helix bundle protein